MTTARPLEQDLDPALRSWLAPLVGEVTVMRQLVGGLTSEMIHLRRTDAGPDVVVRRWPTRNDRAPALVRRESAGLRALAGTDLPVPALIAADPGGISGRPTTLTTFLDGAVELDPPDLRSWTRQLAALLVRIHTLPLPELEPSPVWSHESHPWLEATGDHALAAEATQLAARPPDPSGTVFSHGDYQHFNVLWQGAEPAAVVDWPSAGTADRGLDVGHCRLNLAVLFSADVAMHFLDDYEELAGVVVDPATDVQQLLCFSEEWPEFIPTQVAGRRRVDGPGMAGRVRETLVRTLRRAG